MATINLFGGAGPTQIAIGGTGGTDAATARTSLGISNIATQSITNHNVLVGSSSNAITSVAPGASGTYLVSNGTGSDPSFQSRAGGSMILLSTKSAAGVTTIDFTGLSTTYDVYVLNMTNFIPVNNDTVALIRFSTDNGSTFGVVSYVWVATYSTYSSGSTFSTSGSGGLSIAGSLGAYPSGMSNADTYRYNATFRLYGIATANKAVITGHWNGQFSSGPSWRQGRSDNTNSLLTTINAIRILNSSGNFSAGTASLYGIAK